MDGSITMSDLFGDRNKCPTTGLGEAVLFCADLLADFQTPCFAVVGLDVRKHSGVGVREGVAAGDELAEAVGAEVVGDEGCFV